MITSDIIEITESFPVNITQDIDILLSNLSYNPIWQTIEWQKMLLIAKYVQKSFFIGIYEDSKLLVYALIEKRDIGLGQYGFFCVGGPIIHDIKSLDILSEQMKGLALKEKVVFIQSELSSPTILAGFKPGYYKNFIEKYTAIIDLKQDNETILAHMKPKGRYNIRVAEKAGVGVIQAPYSLESLDIFYNILSETLERDKFTANSKEYFRIFLQYLEERNLG
jgi:lipid II:glycine glycyltransferase (peptidoglycan interpeptide bridge formation enzyme)